MWGRKPKAQPLTLSQKTIRRARGTLTGGRWFLISGLVFYSLMTTTPFVSAHSEWSWSGVALGLIVDAAFIMSLEAESTLAKYGVTGLGRWPAAFRWFTGLSSVFLNIWVSAAAHDAVGVAVHLIAPALVMLLAEVGPIYMAALTRAESGLTVPVAVPAELLTLVDDEPVAKPQKPVESLPAAPPAERLPKAEADKIIAEGWKHNLTVKEVAAAATRHPATVSRAFVRLDAELIA